MMKRQEIKARILSEMRSGMLIQLAIGLCIFIPIYCIAVLPAMFLYGAILGPMLSDLMELNQDDGIRIIAIIASILTSCIVYKMLRWDKSVSHSRARNVVCLLPLIHFTGCAIMILYSAVMN